MAIYVCSICGNKQESVGRPEECEVCGGQEFRIEGEQAVSPGDRDEVRNEARDIAPLYAKHNMVFPPVRKEEDREELRKFRTEVSRQFQDEAERLKKNAYKCGAETLYEYYCIFAVIGLAGSFVTCFYVENFPWFWLVTTVAIGIGYLIFKFNRDSTVKRNQEKAKKTPEEGEEKIRKFEQQQEQKYQSYCTEFEKTSQRLSEEYVGTDFVIQMAEWIFEPFDQAIAAADRGERIQTIRLSYSYSIAPDRILSSSGTYDFRGHGLADLDDPICQTALSKAIAAALRILVMQKYSPDPSGGQSTVSYEIRYDEKRPTVTVVYEAKNGRYDSKSTW